VIIITLANLYGAKVVLPEPVLGFELVKDMQVPWAFGPAASNWLLQLFS
jgi:hypothetical protein